MNELYKHYYEANLSQSDSQQLDLKSFAQAARKYQWNYRRFFRGVAEDAAILDLAAA